VPTLALRRLAPVLLLTALAFGCADSDDEPDQATAAESESTPESASPETTSEPQPADSCQVLDDAEVEELAGQPLGPGRETEVDGVLPVCIWGTLGDVGVQAGVVPADLWARSLPDLVARLTASGTLDDANLQKLEDAAELVESGETIPADQACVLFSQLVELNGMPAGSDSTVNLVPDRDDPQGITGQSCRDGAFGTVVLARPDLTGSDAEIQLVEDALASLPTPAVA
jgi:hypothetical protein